MLLNSALHCMLRKSSALYLLRGTWKTVGLQFHNMEPMTDIVFFNCLILFTYNTLLFIRFLADSCFAANSLT